MTNSQESIKEFFHTISLQLIQFIGKNKEHTSITVQKDSTSLNYATEVDFATEKIIVDALKKSFPNDRIIAEETLSNEEIDPKQNYWVIDPICGTANLAHGVPMFCTNITHIENNNLVASCVVDYSRKEYIWSTGNGKIYVNESLLKKEKTKRGTVIEVDLACFMHINPEKKAKHLKRLLKLIEKDYILITHGSSLSFAYCATGRINGVISPFHALWDSSASVFLIQQAGGVTTDLDGNPWNVSTHELLAADTPELHAELLSLINSN